MVFLKGTEVMEALVCMQDNFECTMIIGAISLGTKNNRTGG